MISAARVDSFTILDAAFARLFYIGAITRSQRKARYVALRSADRSSGRAGFCAIGVSRCTTWGADASIWR